LKKSFRLNNLTHGFDLSGWLLLQPPQENSSCLPQTDS